MSFQRLGLVSVACVLGLTGTAAPAANAVSVEHSGKTFHVAVCGHGHQLRVARCFAHVVTDSQGNIRETGPHKGKPGSGPTTPGGYGPTDLHDAYKLTGSGNSGYTVAIVDANGYTNAESDLATYRSQFHLTACTTANGCFRKVDQNGGTNYPRQDTGWAQETALDLDMVSAICWGCHILLVEANSASFADLAAAEQEAAQLGADAISNSYGGSESGSQSFESAYNHPGVAVTVSSGDSGFGVQFPASSPHVTAVGGTRLARSGGNWSESVWSGAGSGCSTTYAKPSWQTDGDCSMRTVADVSAVADPNTGVAVYGPVSSRRSGWMIFGGTSVAAPLIAGVYGVNGGTATAGSDPYNHSSSLNDVTSGSNGSCNGSYLCTGTFGYDGPSGLGTPNGSNAF